jgi:hypothetical protein
MKLGGAVSIAGALVLAGCAPDYVTSNSSPVNLLIAAINEGNVLDSDVRLGADSNLVCPDVVKVALAVRAKNPGGPTSDVIPMHVLIQGYEVSYIRSDGRGVEGFDVPQRINGAMASEVDLANSGTSDMLIEVVRRQAKLEPPLSNLSGYQVVTMFATVTIHGQTVAGQAVSATGQMQIDFADYGDTLTSCPTQQ